MGGLLHTDDIILTSPNSPVQIPQDNYYHVDISNLRFINCTNCGSLAINVGDYVHINIHDNYIYNNAFGSSNYIYIYNLGCIQIDGKNSSLKLERNNVTGILPSASTYSFLRSKGTNVGIQMRNNNLTCYETAQTTIYSKIASDRRGEEANSYKGAIYIFDGIVEVNTNVYRNCYYGNGSIYQTGENAYFNEESGDYQCNYYILYIYYIYRSWRCFRIIILDGKSYIKTYNYPILQNSICNALYQYEKWI